MSTAPTRPCVDEEGSSRLMQLDEVDIQNGLGSDENESRNEVQKLRRRKESSMPWQTSIALQSWCLQWERAWCAVLASMGCPHCVCHEV